MQRATPRGIRGSSEPALGMTRAKRRPSIRFGLLAAPLMSHFMFLSISLSISLAISLAAALGCTPKVAIEAPKEPIVINMNIKVEHEIRINVDQDLEQLFEEDEEIF